MTSKNSARVQSLDRALDLVEALASHGEAMGITDLAEATGLPLPTTHRMIARLVAPGDATQAEGSRRYSLGARLVDLSSVAGRMFGRSMKLFLERLVDATGKTANLALLEDGDIVCVAQAVSPRLVRMFAEVGNQVLPHRTAVRKVMLADLPQGEVERLLRRNGIPAATKNSITEVDAFRRELHHACERGFAVGLGGAGGGYDLCRGATPSCIGHGGRLVDLGAERPHGAAAALGDRSSIKGRGGTTASVDGRPAVLEPRARPQGPPDRGVDDAVRTARHRGLDCR